MELDNVGKRDTWTNSMKRLYSRSLLLFYPPFEKKVEAPTIDPAVIKQGF